MTEMPAVDHAMPIDCRNARKIAVFAGAYGNVPAMKACIEDAKSKQCDRLAFIGDAIGCCGHSNEILDLINTSMAIRVAGNHEQQAVLGQESCGCGYTSRDDELLGCQAFALATGELDACHRKALAHWPNELMLDSACGRILLCHGSPDRTNEFLYESQLDHLRLRKWLEQRDVIGFVCSHSGLPWIRSVDSSGFAVNCGVVGKPDHDGDTAVHYAILDCSRTGMICVTIESVTYDARAWAMQLRQQGVPEIFITPLETGIWTTGVKSLPESQRSPSRNFGPLRLIMPVPARHRIKISSGKGSIAT